jgi:hypothetical protein
MALAALGPCAVLIALGCRALAEQGWFLVDDSYITFRYARNLAAGHGLVWNPGEPVEGYTNLLWVLLLAPFAALRIDLVAPAMTMCGLAACGCLELLRRIARDAWPERSPLVHALAPLVLATSPSFAYWSLQGMETPLFALLVLYAARLLVRARRAPALGSDGRGRFASGPADAAPLRWLAGLALAAAYLARPEGLLVAALLLSVELAAAHGPLRARLRQLLAPALVVAAVAAAHLAFRLAYYGELLPNTFHAKVIIGSLSLARGLHHLAMFLLAGGVLVLPGVLALRGPGALRAHLAQGYVLLAGYTIYLVVIGGDFPWWFRFYLPLMPLPLLGLVALLSRLAWRPLACALAIAIAAAGPTLAWPRAEAAFSPLVLRTGDNLRGLILFFFRKLPRESYVAASAVGMVGYYTELRILDAWGLNDRAIARRKVAPDPRSVFAHDKTDWDYVLSRAPDYVFSYRPEGSRFPPKLHGYEACWHAFRVPFLLLYRRSFPLAPWQLELGMPPGVKRTLLLPPPC